jgi:hypothetical protein
MYSRFECTLIETMYIRLYYSNKIAVVHINTAHQIQILFPYLYT